MPSRSKIETISTRVVFLNRAMNSLVMAGSAMRSACGSTISRVDAPVAQPERLARPRPGPRAAPAGRRARPRPCRRAITKASPITARARRSTSKPVGMISGSSSEARKITVMIGTPRQNSMNTTEAKRISGRRDRRPSASRMPSGMAISAGIDRDEEGQHQPAPFARLDESQAEARRRAARCRAAAGRPAAAIAELRRRGRPRQDRARRRAPPAARPTRSTRQRSGSGYWPYMNWPKRALDEHPAGAGARAVLAAGAVPVRVDQQPVDQRHRDAPDDVEADSSVIAASSGVANRRWRRRHGAQPHRVTSAMAGIVPVHERRHGEADGQVDAERDGDDLDRLAGVRPAPSP